MPRVRGVDLVEGTERVVLLPDVLRTTPRRVREGSSVSTPERCTPRKVLPPATTPLRVRLLARAPVLLPWLLGALRRPTRKSSSAVP